MTDNPVVRGKYFQLADKPIFDRPAGIRTAYNWAIRLENRGLGTIVDNAASQTPTLHVRLPGKRTGFVSIRAYRGWVSFDVYHSVLREYAPEAAQRITNILKPAASGDSKETSEVTLALMEELEEAYEEAAKPAINTLNTSQNSSSSQPKRSAQAQNPHHSLKMGSTQFRESFDSATADQLAQLEFLTSWAESMEQSGYAVLRTTTGNNRWALRIEIPGPNTCIAVIRHEVGSSIVIFRSVLERYAPTTIPKLEQAIGQHPMKHQPYIRECTQEILELLESAYRIASENRRT